MGVAAKNTTAEPVDFREQQGIYILYDDNYRMVYVGQAGANDKQRMYSRLKQHLTDNLAERWAKFSWFGLRWVKANGTLSAEVSGAHTTNKAVLNHIEAILITAAEPPHNRQGGRFGEEVKQYLQHRDHEQLGPDFVEMVRDLWERRNAG